MAVEEVLQGRLRVLLAQIVHADTEQRNRSPAGLGSLEQCDGPANNRVLVVDAGSGVAARDCGELL